MTIDTLNIECIVPMEMSETLLMVDGARHAKRIKKIGYDLIIEE
jgi:hypothetical protein